MEVMLDGWKGSSFTQVTAPQKIWDGWRCLHQAEGGYPNPDRMPIVRPSVNAPPVMFSEPLQLVAYKVNAFNPKFTGNKFRSTYDYQIAFTNGEGFGDSNDPRADFVNRVDLLYPIPKLMKAIICGGNFFTGKVVYSLMAGLKEAQQTFILAAQEPSFVKRSNEGLARSVLQKVVKAVIQSNLLQMTPGVDAADATKAWVDVERWTGVILEKHWYFHATTRNGTVINNFPQGVMNPVYVPYFLAVPVVYPLSWFERWVSTELPDPLKIYSPI